jgi:hypothetical protein
MSGYQECTIEFTPGPIANYAEAVDARVDPALRTLGITALGAAQSPPLPSEPPRRYDDPGVGRLLGSDLHGSAVGAGRATLAVLGKVDPFRRALGTFRYQDVDKLVRALRHYCFESSTRRQKGAR